MTVSVYCTKDEIKAMMPDTDWGSSYDVLLDTLASRASRAIDRFTKRSAGAYAVTENTTRSFSALWSNELDIGELAAPPTSVSIAEAGDPSDLTELAPTDYYLLPYNAVVIGRPYNFIVLDSLNGNFAAFPHFPNSVVVTGPFGYSTVVPDEIKQATLIQAIRWFKRGQQSYQDTGAITELGQLTYTKAIDPDVAMMIEYFKQVTV